jgi:hypothetical protein
MSRRNQPKTPVPASFDLLQANQRGRTRADNFKGVLEMKISRSLMSIILGVLLLAGCGGKEAGRYYDKANKFSIKFPAGWLTTAIQSGGQEGEVLTASNPDNTATASIRVQKYGLGSTLTIFSKELSQKLGAGKQLEGGIVKIDSRDAYWIVCDGNGAGPEFTTFYYCLTMEDKIYSIIFVTGSDKFPARRPELEAIAGSFKFE